MGRVQEPSGVKTNGKHRLNSDAPDARSKKRKDTGQTPKAWSQPDELNLVRILLEHKQEGRTVPESRTATYWSELVSLLFRGQNVAERRLHDKVKRMVHRYNECKQQLQEGKEPWRNAHEEVLFGFWVKIFGDQTDVPKTLQQPSAKVVKVAGASSVKPVEASDSSSEEEQEVAPKGRVPPSTPMKAVSPSGSSSESDEEDEVKSSPGKRLPANPGARGQGVPNGQGRERRRSLSRNDTIPGSVVKPGSKVSRENDRHETITTKYQLRNAEKGETSSKHAMDHLNLDADVINSLRAELLQYVQNLRDDCMRELDKISKLIPPWLDTTRGLQAHMLESISLYEKELEINTLYCRLHKEALKPRHLK